MLPRALAFAKRSCLRVPGRTRRPRSRPNGIERHQVPPFRLLAQVDVSSPTHVRLPDGSEAPDDCPERWRECYKQVPTVPEGQCRCRLRRADGELLQHFLPGRRLRSS